MKRAVLVLFLVLALAGISSASPNLEGIYDCRGAGAGGASGYDGTVAIIRNGDVYNVVWILGAATYLGVGLLQGDQFSVSYADAQHANIGIAVYRVNGDTLTGVWATPGSSAAGSETLTRRRAGA